MRNIILTLLLAFPASAETQHLWAGGYSSIRDVGEPPTANDVRDAPKVQATKVGGDP